MRGQRPDPILLREFTLRVNQAASAPLEQSFATGLNEILSSHKLSAFCFRTNACDKEYVCRWFLQELAEWKARNLYIPNPQPRMSVPGGITQHSHYC